MKATWHPSNSDIGSVQLLSEDGVLGDAGEYSDSLPSDECAVEIYRLMVLGRRIDEEAVRLQRQGELALYPPILGQEAAQVAGAVAFAATDWLFIGYRDLGPLVARGVEPVEIMHFWRGTWHGGGWDPRAARVAPYCAPVASQVPHAVGFGLGEKLARRDGVVGCYFGDGATSTGDFHEGCNLAGVFGAPVVFICQNNQIALSVPLNRQTAAPALAAKAVGYGFSGIRVDGNDAIAMYAVVRKAVSKARAGGGPTLIEAVTYRMGPHSTADDPKRYRAEAEVDAWRSRDPILRLQKHLRSVGLLDDKAIAGIDEEAAVAAEALRAEVVALETPEPAEMFEYVVAEPDSNPRLREGKKRLRAELERRGVGG